MEPPAMQLPALDSPYPITAEQVDSFGRDGHILLRGLASREELAAFRPHILAAAARDYARLTAEERQLYMMGNLWEHDELVRLFVQSPRFARVAADLLQADAVRLWRDVVFIKEPGEPETPWHQDRHWEPIDTPRFLGVWFALHDVPPDMSALRFATGSHTGGRIALPDHEGRSQAALTESIGARFPIVKHSPLAAGDATLHLGWTLHGSDVNRAAQRREAVAMFYYADGARILSWPDDADPNWARVQRHHLALRFPGRAPGDLGESERCPIVYSRRTDS
jgi:ectoine hydroxylase-related dioxygenase (phytanoyl-CoA dioxygenase family)